VPEPLKIGPETPLLARPICTVAPPPSAGSLAMRGVPLSMPELAVLAPVAPVPAVFVPVVSLELRLVIVPDCEPVVQPVRPPELVVDDCVVLVPGTTGSLGTAGADTIGGEPLDPGVVPATGGGATALGL